MFVDEFNRGSGELPPRPQPSNYSKGYPEKPLETPRGILKSNLDAGSLHTLRQHYAPSGPR